MLENFPKEKLQEIYEILPQDLKEALFSQETAETINDVCSENEIGEKQISRIIEYVGYVLLGLVSPNDFEKTIKENLFLKEDLASRINRQITRLVFFPLKTSLELIYKIEIKVPKEIIKEKLPIAEETPKEEKPILKKSGRDTYREPVE